MNVFDGGGGGGGVVDGWGGGGGYDLQPGFTMYYISRVLRTLQLNLTKKRYISANISFRTDSRCNYGDIDIFCMHIYAEIATSGVNN